MVVKERMTAQQAKSFGRYSIANAAQVEHSLVCGCRAYHDVFTYNRWLAQGFQVQRGQKAVKIPVVITKETEDQEGEVKHTKLLRTSAVFCRHQVAPVVNGKVQQQPRVEAPAETTPTPVTPAATAPNGFVADVMASWKEL